MANENNGSNGGGNNNNGGHMGQPQDQAGVEGASRDVAANAPRDFGVAEPHAVGWMGQCLAIGVVSGLRSMAAPAIVLGDLVRREPDFVHSDLLMKLASPLARNIALGNAGGEVVADKLPSVPARTQANSVIFRSVSGMLSAGVLALSRGGSPVIGGALGIVGSLVGTYGGYELRKAIGAAFHIPDAVVAVGEDYLAFKLGAAAVRDPSPA